MNSIRRTLLVWLSIGISSGIMAAGLLIYFQAREEANQLFDYQMKQVVASLPTQAFSPVAPSRDDPGDERGDVVIQIWDSSGLRIYRSHERTALPQRAELGFANVSMNGIDWRVYSAQIGDTVVQVAQPQSTRRQIAAGMALKTLTPLILLLPLLAGLIWLTVGRGLSSVKRAANDVQLRDAGSLAPISDDDVPQEIRPLTAALNDLLKRLDLAMGAQRTFVADAAHELKTPLTALSLQIQLAERASSDAARQIAFTDLRQGLERASHLVHQLLTLARQEPGAAEVKRQKVDLSSLASHAIGDFAMMATTKNIDLGMIRTAQVSLIGDADALRTMLDNLLDNAIRYCPQGSRIDVAVDSDMHSALLTVRDNGPGIPEADLARIFDRFYRVAGTPGKGSGLGLAIVKQIALSHHAEVAVESSNGGFCVMVKFLFSPYDL